MADLKGKRVRATGGNAEMFKMAGMVPVGATLVEAVGLLQRGGLDCQHGIHDWLRTFGYGDVAKYVMDYSARPHRARDRLLHEPRHLEELHAGAEEDPPEAGGLAERQAGDRQFHRLQRGFAQHRDQGQGRSTGEGRQRLDPVADNYKKVQRDANVATARNFGVADPGKIIDTMRRRSSAGGRYRRRSGRDIDKYTDLLNREIFSKVDPDKL